MWTTKLGCWGTGQPTWNVFYLHKLESVSCYLHLWMHIALESSDWSKLAPLSNFASMDMRYDTLTCSCACEMKLTFYCAQADHMWDILAAINLK